MIETPVHFGVPDVWIAYPEPGEAVRLGHYSFQICAASRAEGVDLSIDHGPWLPCRESMGLWWADWTGYSGGPHEAQARIRLHDGSLELSEKRLFVVV